MNSSNAEGLSNFNISKNSSLIVTNPRNSSLQGLLNVTCIASSNNTMNDNRIIYRIAFFKGNENTLHYRQSKYDLKTLFYPLFHPLSTTYNV